MFKSSFRREQTKETRQKVTFLFVTERERENERNREWKKERERERERDGETTQCAVEMQICGGVCSSLL